MNWGDMTPTNLERYNMLVAAKVAEIEEEKSEKSTLV